MRYSFCGFLLDADNFQLSKNGELVDLRAKAFHVLAFLLNNRHRMVTKDELLNEVWHKQVITEATLNSCIKTVRQALGDDGRSQNIIQTVRARGYRFVAPVELVKSGTATAPTISVRLNERFDKSFVGRGRELKTIMQAFSQPVMPFWVCFIYGSGGIGKTSLLRGLCRKVAGENLVLHLDCREMEPTREGFLAALNTCLASGLRQEATLESVCNQLHGVTSKVLLCIDQFESFVILESWLRTTFFPALPESVFTVIASRQAPKSPWYMDPQWSHGFFRMELGELTDEETTSMLQSRQLQPQQIRQVKKFAKGYPLALELAAMLCRTQPHYRFPTNLAPVEIISELATSVLTGLSDVEREAIEAISTVHRANEPILCALLELRDSHKLFLKLRELPFVSYSDQGISLHDVVHDAVTKDLSYRDPVRYRQYREKAWRYFRDVIDDACYQRVWCHTADLLFLIETPIIRQAYFPVGSSEISIQPAQENDVSAIIDMIESEEDSQSAAVLSMWLQYHMEHFYVARSAEGEIVGVETFFAPETVSRELLDKDPLTAAWAKHLKRNPVREHERILFFRRWLSRGNGDGPSPVQGAFWVDIKRVYMEMRPVLRRLYMTVNDMGSYKPVCRSIGFEELEDCHVRIGDRDFYTLMVDFGPHSLDGWIVRLVKKQLDGHSGGRDSSLHNN